MILMDVELDDDRLPLLRATEQPAVLIGLPTDTGGVTCVDLDWSATGALCVEHLAKFGHRDVGLRVLHHPWEGGYDAMAVTLSRIFDERPCTTGFATCRWSPSKPRCGSPLPPSLPRRWAGARSSSCWADSTGARAATWCSSHLN